MRNSLKTFVLVLCALSLATMVQAQSVSQQAPHVGPSGSAFQLPPQNVDPGRLQNNVGANPPVSAAQSWPQYQYPQHNNPFYDGGTPGGMVSDTIDWLMALPSGLMDRFGEFVDTRFFPQKPATSGAPESPGSSPNQTQAPLPPANAYNPSGR